jgi:hypothetical protein
VIILSLFPGILTNGVADISKLLGDLEAVTEILPQEMRDKYVTLAADRQMKLASAFREHMTKGQTYQAPNSYREAFYTEVVNEAKEVNFRSIPVFVRMTVFSSLWKNSNTLTAEACKRQAKASLNS